MRNFSYFNLSENVPFDEFKQSCLTVLNELKGEEVLSIVFHYGMDFSWVRIKKNEDSYEYNFYNSMNNIKENEYKKSRKLLLKKILDNAQIYTLFNPLQLSNIEIIKYYKFN